VVSQHHPEWTADPSEVDGAAATFARLPRLPEVGRVGTAVLGVPLESGASRRPGARFGPAAVRAASRLLRADDPQPGVQPWPPQPAADAGDIAAPDAERVSAAAGQVLDRAERLIAIGGDHTIVSPLLRAMHQRHGPLALIHFDAHLDTWDTAMATRHTHGVPFRPAIEAGLLDRYCSAHVGSRGSRYDTPELSEDRELGYPTVSAEDIARDGVDRAIDRLRERVGALPIYLSIDIDVLDPAHAPGTASPEPGGLTTRELQLLLRGLGDLPIVGADIIEVSPAHDHAGLTALAAANTGYELLALFARIPR